MPSSRRWKFACCGERWLDSHPMSHCGRCGWYFAAVGELTEDDDPADWGEPESEADDGDNT